jgi:hypothetical protein
MTPAGERLRQASQTLACLRESFSEGKRAEAWHYKVMLCGEFCSATLQGRARCRSLTLYILYFDFVILIFDP